MLDFLDDPSFYDVLPPKGAPRCACGKEIDTDVAATFGGSAMCPNCNALAIRARITAQKIRKILNSAYALSGPEGMAALKREIHPALKQFGLI